MTACLSIGAAIRAVRAIEVLIPPGKTQDTLTCGCRINISCRSDSVKPRTANLAALYAEYPGADIKPNAEETLTMFPSFDRNMKGKKRF